MGNQPCMGNALELADAAFKHLACPVLVAGAARLGPLWAAACLTELQVLLRTSAHVDSYIDLCWPQPPDSRTQ